MIWPKNNADLVPSSLPAVTLVGERTLMRPPQIGDWQDWRRVRSENYDFLKPYEPSWPRDCLSEDHFRRKLQNHLREWETGRAQAFLIFTAIDNALIGGMNINNICRGTAQFASLGYWLAQDAQGQGYMAEALRLTLAYCFSTLGLHRVHASCLLHNTRSKNCLLRAGFVLEGRAENYLKIDGRWQDHELFGFTLERWQSDAYKADLKA